MANTGNTQQIINYGATANDGTGDPLRTAFIKTDENFDNVWLAGPVGSNITISNNTIQTNNTNGNLILKPNGTGIIQANASVLPNSTSTRDLGSSAQSWRRAYIDELLPETLTVTGDATIGGNLTVEGDTIQIGNITTDTLTVQLANTAANASSANGAGVTVGANDAIATFLFNSTSNTWITNIGANVSGNITANYFFGNGSLLTGITSYANANAVAYGQAGWAGNIIPAANAVYSLGNATNYWSNLWVANNTIYIGGVPLGMAAGNILTVNGAEVVTTSDNEANIANLEILSATITIKPGAPDTDVYISPSGESYAFLQVPTNDTANVTNTRLHNDAGNVEIGAGDTTNGNPTYEWDFTNSGTLTFPASQTSVFGGMDNDFTIDTANANGATYTFTFGQFGDLSVPVNLNVSGNVYTDDIVGTGNGNLTVTANTQSWVFDTEGAVTLPGNSAISASANTIRVSAGTGDLTGVLLNNTGDAEIYANSNISLYTDSDNTGQNWTFDTTGNLILPAGGDLNFVAGGIAQTVDEDFTILVQDGDDDGFSVYLNVDDGSGTVLSQYQQQRDQFELGFPASSVYYQFNDNGTLVLPANAAVWTDASSNISIIARSVSDSSFVEMMTQDNSDIKRSNVTVTRDNVTVTTSSGAYNWTFDVNGELWVPGGTGYISSAANTITMYSDAAELNGILFYGDGAGNDGVDIYAASMVTIFANNAGATRETRFLADGTISVQGMIYPVTGYTAVDLGNSTNNFRDGWFSGNVKASGLLIDTVTGITANAGNVNINQITGLGGWLNAVGANLSGNVNADSLNIVDINVTGNIISNLYADGEVEILGNVNIENQLTVDGLLVDTVSGITANAGNIDINQITGLGGYLNAVGANISGTITGDVLISSNQSGIEGGEINLSLPAAANTTLSGNIVVIDSYGDRLRFFEGGGSTRGLYMDLANSPAGVGAAIGYRDIPQVAFSANATAAISDAGKHFYSTTAGNLSLLIPTNTNVAFPTGATLTVVVNAAGNVLVNADTGVSLYMAGSSTTGNRVVGAYGLASVMKVATDTWVISGTGVY